MPTVFRIDLLAQTTVNGSLSPGAEPQLLAIPGATVALYTDAAATLLAATYTDATGNTACPLTAQATLPGSSLPTGIAGPQGQFGFWIVPGVNYYYTVTTPGGQKVGPFPVSSPASTADWVSTLTRKPVVDVRSFGAKGDGVTVDTAAFLAAFNSLLPVTGSGGVLGSGGGTVFVPPGNYVATVVVPSNCALVGADPIATNIYAPGAGAVVVATAPQSVGCQIRNLTVWLNFKQNCVAFDIVSTQDGVFENLRVVGGGDLGPGNITGIGMRIRSAGTTIPDIVAYNRFENIHLEICPTQGMVIGHNDDGTCRPVTLNSWRNIRVGGAASPLIDIIGNADTNYMEHVTMDPGTGAYGIELNSGNPTVENNVAGWTFVGISGGQGASASVFLFRYCTYIQVLDLESLAPTPYTTTNSPLSISMDIPVGIVNGAGTHLRTLQLLGGLRLGQTNASSFVATPRTDVVLVNGANQNIDPKEGMFLRIQGPTGVFSLGGFSGGEDGRRLVVYNANAFAMTISNQAAGSSATNRILTLTGADVVLRAGVSCATFVYSGAENLWILVSTN